MPKDLVLVPGILVRSRALRVRAVRSSGAGGQNVNKVSSKIELSVDPLGIEGLPEGARARLRRLVAGRLASDGHLVFRSQRTRDQHRNLEDAYDKLRSLVERALVEPKTRRATRATTASRERRLRSKKARSDVKRLRHRAASPDD